MNIDSNEEKLTVEQKREIDEKYNDCLEMFETSGWKHYVADTQETLKQLRDTVSDMPDDKVLGAVNYNRGFAAAAAFEQIVRNNHTQWLDYLNGEAENAPV